MSSFDFNILDLLKGLISIIMDVIPILPPELRRSLHRVRSEQSITSNGSGGGGGSSSGSFTNLSC